MYEKLRKVMEADEKFKSEVKVDIYSDNRDIYIDSEGDALIKYDIDVEYRSYGIHGILPILYESTTVVYTQTTGEGTDNEKTEDKEITVDMSRIKIDWVEGDGYYPVSLSVNLNVDGSVNYDKSYIEFAYYKP